MEGNQGGEPQIDIVLSPGLYRLTIPPVFRRFPAAADAHVRLAVGPDYVACAPIRGMRRGGGEEDMNVHVSVAAMEQ